jgi:hypothetical protein
MLNKRIWIVILVILICNVVRTQDTHSHNVKFLDTWNDMRIIPGFVLESSDDRISLFSVDRYINRSAEYSIVKGLTRMSYLPKKGVPVILIYCPLDKTIFAILNEDK